MNRQQFLAELNQYLTFFSPEERANIIAAYNERFDAEGPEKEYSLIAELGTPMMTAIDLKRRMEAGERIALACEPEAPEAEPLSEYSVETETEASLDAIAEIQETAPAGLEGEAPVAEAEADPEEVLAEPIYEAPQFKAPVEYQEKKKPSRKISVGGLIGATLLSLVIVAVFLAISAVGIALLVAMSYLLLTGLKSLLYITDALLLFGGGLVCAALGILIVWFAVSSAIGLISRLFRRALGLGSDKECAA